MTFCQKMNPTNNDENQSLVGAQFGHAITVTIMYWVIKLLGLHVWGFMGKAGAIILGIVTVLSVISNLGMLGMIFSHNSELKSEGSSSGDFIIPMIFKFGVDCLAAFLVYKLFVLFF